MSEPVVDTISSHPMRARFQTAATVLVCVLILGVPLVSGNVVSGIDVVTLLTPLALLGGLLLIRSGGLSSLLCRKYAVAAALFLVWALISIAVIGTNRGSELMTWIRYLSYFLLIPAVGLVASSSKDRTALLWALAIAGVGASLYGLYQFVNPSIMSDTFAASAAIPVRVYSTFTNPNFFSEFLLISLCGSGALFVTYVKKRRTACGAVVVMILIQLAAFFLTYTRGSWLALAAGIVVAALVLRPRLAGICAVLIILVGLIPPVLTRILGIFSGDGSTKFRLGLWKAALTAIKEKPLFGGGLGDFYTIYQHVVETHPALYQGYSQFGSHNSYLQLTAETGILGGLLFICAVVGLVWAGVWLARRARRAESKRVTLQAALLLAGLTAFILNALTSDSFQHPHAAVYFFVLAGTLMGLGSGQWHTPKALSSSAFYQKVFGAKPTPSDQD